MKKLGVQTNQIEVLVCYDFQSGIFDEEDNLMFAIKPELFLIGTIAIPKKKTNKVRASSYFYSINKCQVS